jgi:hypothetical protein
MPFYWRNTYNSQLSIYVNKESTFFLFYSRQISQWIKNLSTNGGNAFLFLHSINPCQPIWPPLFLSAQQRGSVRIMLRGFERHSNFFVQLTSLRGSPWLLIVAWPQIEPLAFLISFCILEIFPRFSLFLYCISCLHYINERLRAPINLDNNAEHILNCPFVYGYFLVWCIGKRVCDGCDDIQQTLLYSQKQ